MDSLARVQIGDADPTAFFNFFRGGRQGGVETREVFNLMMKSVCSELIESWESRCLGFTSDCLYFVTHAVWADNFFLIARSQDQAAEMLSKLMAVIYARGFRWKPSSLECMCSLNTIVSGSLQCQPPNSDPLQINFVDQMLVLGVLLDRTGSTDVSISWRMAQADKKHFTSTLMFSAIGGEG